MHRVDGRQARVYNASLANNDVVLYAESPEEVGLIDSTPSPAGENWVTMPCAMCTNECGIQVHVRNGKIVGVRGWAGHPFSRGGICVKARQIPDHVYSDSRLKYPMRKRNGEWQRISWDEALDTIARKLSESKERYGAASLGAIVGEPVEVVAGLGVELIWRFCDVYGTPNRFHTGDLCCVPNILAQRVTLGGMFDPDVANSKCIVVWADNPHETSHVVHSQIVNARKRGAKLIVIDPRRTSLSEQADIHIRPRPGTDGILLLAMINIIISERLYDSESVENWTTGFDKLAEHVRRYTPEEAERVSGVAAEDIKKIARVYATTRHACIQYGFKLHQCRCGFDNCRSVAILSAITGNVDAPGGDLERSPSPLRGARPTRVKELLGGLKHPAADKTPIYSFSRFAIEGCMPNWGDLVLNEPQQVRSMIISGANPAVTWPNSAKVRKALDKLDFLVVMDVIMTATAQMADIVLPACTFLEKLALVNWRGWAMRRPLIDPLWESRPDCNFWVELAGRMGYEQHFPWKNEQEIFDYFYEPAGLTVDKVFDAHPDGFIRSHGLPGEYQYQQKGFRTPSGKVELYSEVLDRLGYNPLPAYLEPRESPISTPELFKEFPLTLTTGTRELEYYHSEHRHLDGLRRRNPEPMAEIHPQDAEKYEISDGEIMIVETKTGCIHIKARVTENIMPGMISVPHGWNEAPENMLTDDTPADPVTGFPAFTSLLCRVRRETPV